MKKQYVQMLVVLVFVIGVSVIVVLNLTKSAALLFDSQTEIKTDEGLESEAQSFKSDTKKTNQQSDVISAATSHVRRFSRDLGVSFNQIVSTDFVSGEYSWANGYDESMISYYDVMIKTNVYTQSELADYINAVARANYRMEKFRIKVLEEKGYNLVKWNENQDTFQYLSDYSRYSVAELYYKEFPEKRVDDQDSYYLNNALK
ncbi:hypothetical protein [Exiguobacterium sp. CinTr1]|uniref:hypothetical protein n=1 Tax=Exiguobacterium sp. CinTr1 TaxID=2995315 RepID=UPI0022DF2432|nr:hypothetical protein [Exiguobacterium sp. CinTr1]